MQEIDKDRVVALADPPASNAIEISSERIAFSGGQAPQPVAGEVSDTRVQQPSPIEDTGLDIPGLPSGEPFTPEQLGSISDVYTPFFEFGGLTGGSIVGGGAGIPGGPGVIAAGAVAGGALGFGMGAEVANILDEFLGIAEPIAFPERVKRAGEEVITGAEYEMLGQALPAGIVASAKGTVALAERMGAGKIINGIKKMFPSLNMKEVLAKARQILDEYRESVRLAQQGKGTISDTVKAVETQQAQLVKNADVATQAARESLVTFQGKGIQDVGEETYKFLKSTQKELEIGYKAVYDQIPKGLRLEGDVLAETMKSVVADYKKIGGGPNTLPSAIMRQIRKALKAKDTKGTVTFDQLQDWSSQIAQEMRDISKSLDPNRKLNRRLKMMMEGVQKNMDEMLELGDEHLVAKETYNKAKGMFLQYVDKFRKGTVSEVVQPGNLNAGNKIAFSDIPSRFFKQGKMDVADDLVRAVGKEDATKLIRDYAAHDLVSGKVKADGTLMLDSGRKWLSRNKTVLNKYGLYDEFADMVSSQHVADDVVRTLTEFNKSLASKVLNSDVDKVISNIFSGVGKRTSGKMIRDLLNVKGIKGNKAAIEGIRESFKDFLLTSMEGRYKDIMGIPIKDIGKAKTIVQEYMPVIETLYRDTPGKIKALKNYHKLLGEVERTVVERSTGPIKSLIESIAQLGFIQAGKGWKYSASRNIGRQLYEMTGAGRSSKNNIELLLRRSIYDPEFAETVMMASEGTVKGLQERVNHHLLKLGIYTMDKLRSQEIEYIP